MTIARAELERRIVEAIIWCREHASVARVRDCLRTQSLLAGLPKHHAESLISGRTELLDFGLTCELISRNRRNLIGLLSAPLSPACNGDGRFFLLYDRTCSFLSGLASKSSLGYFDEEDTPPWDSWIYYGTFSSCIDLEARPISDNVTGVLAVVPEIMFELAMHGLRKSVETGIILIEDPLVQIV